VEAREESVARTTAERLANTVKAWT
jgi:hypothetical protein